MRGSKKQRYWSKTSFYNRVMHCTFPTSIKSRHNVFKTFPWFNTCRVAYEIRIKYSNFHQQTIAQFGKITIIALFYVQIIVASSHQSQHKFSLAACCPALSRAAHMRRAFRWPSTRSVHFTCTFTLTALINSITIDAIVSRSITVDVVWPSACL